MDVVVERVFFGLRCRPRLRPRSSDVQWGDAQAGPSGLSARHWLVLTVPRGIRVAAKTVTVADLTIRPMDYELHLLPLGRGSAGRLGLDLGCVELGRARGTFAIDCQPVGAGNHVDVTLDMHAFSTKGNLQVDQFLKSASMQVKSAIKRVANATIGISLQVVANLRKYL